MTYYLLLITIVSIIYLGQLSLIASIHLPTNSSEPLSNVGLHDVSVFEVCLNKILLSSYFHLRRIATNVIFCGTFLRLKTQRMLSVKLLCTARTFLP
jgi:hypothetical protein